MTCTIHNFADYSPSALIQPTDECARLEAMSAARAILRSPAPHSDETLAWSCRTIKGLADPSDPDELCDVLQADAMLLTMRMAARKRAREAAVKQARRGTIRLGLLDAAALLMFGAAVLVVGLAL